MNIILGVLTNNKKLRTICLAGDTIPEGGTAECQSTAIVDQFTECGQLIKVWREKTIELYANDPNLDDLITSIPRKEDLCVSGNLVATLSANNCSTAQLCHSRTSERIFDLSRVNGITDKARLVHYFGNCNNHMQNTWCNDIAIIFGRRKGEALADDLPAFAPHLRITGELMHAHK